MYVKNENIFDEIKEKLLQGISLEQCKKYTDIFARELLNEQNREEVIDCLENIIFSYIHNTKIMHEPFACNYRHMGAFYVKSRERKIYMLYSHLFKALEKQANFEILEKLLVNVQNMVIKSLAAPNSIVRINAVVLFFQFFPFLTPNMLKDAKKINSKYQEKLFKLYDVIKDLLNDTCSEIRRLTIQYLAMIFDQFTKLVPYNIILSIYQYLIKICLWDFEQPEIRIATLTTLTYLTSQSKVPHSILTLAINEKTTSRSTSVQLGEKNECAPKNGGRPNDNKNFTCILWEILLDPEFTIRFAALNFFRAIQSTISEQLIPLKDIIPLAIFMDLIVWHFDANNNLEYSKSHVSRQDTQKYEEMLLKLFYSTHINIEPHINLGENLLKNGERDGSNDNTNISVLAGYGEHTIKICGLKCLKIFQTNYKASCLIFQKLCPILTAHEIQALIYCYAQFFKYLIEGKLFIKEVIPIPVLLNCSIENNNIDVDLATKQKKANTKIGKRNGNDKNRKGKKSKEATLHEELGSEPKLSPNNALACKAILTSLVICTKFARNQISVKPNSTDLALSTNAYQCLNDCFERHFELIRASPFFGEAILIMGFTSVQHEKLNRFLHEVLMDPLKVSNDLTIIQTSLYALTFMGKLDDITTELIELCKSNNPDPLREFYLTLLEFLSQCLIVSLLKGAPISYNYDKTLNFTLNTENLPNMMLQNQMEAMPLNSNKESIDSIGSYIEMQLKYLFESQNLDMIKDSSRANYYLKLFEIHTKLLLYFGIMSRENNILQKEIYDWLEVLVDTHFTSNLNLLDYSYNLIENDSLNNNDNDNKNSNNANTSKRNKRNINVGKSKKVKKNDLKASVINKSNKLENMVKLKQKFVIDILSLHMNGFMDSCALNITSWHELESMSHLIIKCHQALKVCLTREPTNDFSKETTNMYRSIYELVIKVQKQINKFLLRLIVQTHREFCFTDSKNIINIVTNLHRSFIHLVIALPTFYESILLAKHALDDFYQTFTKIFEELCDKDWTKPPKKSRKDKEMTKSNLPDETKFEQLQIILNDTMAENRKIIDDLANQLQTEESFDFINENSKNNYKKIKDNINDKHNLKNDLKDDLNKNTPGKIKKLRLAAQIAKEKRPQKFVKKTRKKNLAANFS